MWQILFLWLLSLVSCIVPSVLFAQESKIPKKTYQFNRIDSRHGLSHNTVFGVSQDQLGYMWFGTADGLNRFDGYSFTVYRHDPANPTSLANNTVRRITEDQNGNLWLHTGSNLDRFDRSAGAFFHYPPHLHRILEDQNGVIWASGVDGIYRYNLQRDIFEKKWGYAQSANTPIIDLKENRPLGLVQDNDGFVWLSTSGGSLYKFNVESGNQQIYSSPWSFTIVKDQDEQGRMIIVHDSGVGIFDPVQEVFLPEKTIPLQANVISMEKTQDGLFWFASNQLYQYDPMLKRSRVVHLESSNKAHLANSIWDVFEDRSGALWVGTLNGVYRTDPHAKPFFHIKHDPANTNSLSNNVVMSVLENKGKELWAGTLGSGLDKIDLQTGNISHFTFAGNPCNNLIWGLFQSKSSVLWIATNTGLCSMDLFTNTIRHWPLSHHGVAADISTGTSPVYVILEDQDGMMWAGGSANLYKLDPSNGFAKSYKSNLKATGGSARITGLLQDSQNRLWIGTVNYELYMMDLETEAITLYRTPGGNELKDGEGLWEIKEDASGNLWLGSDRGLFLFNPETTSFLRYGTSAGVPSDFIYSIQIDNKGFIWASTNAGLVRFLNPAQQASPVNTTLDSLQIYEAGDGIGNTEFNRRASFKSNRGRLYFGGTEGLTYFDPRAIHNNPHIPPVVLTSVQITSPDTTRQVNPFGLTKLNLTHRDYSVAFEFAGLSYTQPEQNQYAYKMEGVDPSWQQAGTRRFSQYTNLKPGNYTFRVRASNNDGVWNQAGLSLDLYVAPPFWKRWWFVLGSSVLFGACIIGLVRFFETRKLRRQVRELELQKRVQHERERISRDLHDNVGAQLSTIISGIELMRLSAKAGQENNMSTYLDAVDRDSKKTLAQLRETIWTLHHDQVTLNELHIKVQEYLQHLQPYHPELSFLINSTDHVHILLSPSEALGLFRIVQEAVHNAVKHANCNQISVELVMEENNILHLTVSDDGTFKDHTNKGPLNGIGLEGMQRRANEIGGSFSIDISDGTQIKVELPFQNR